MVSRGAIRVSGDGGSYRVRRARHRTPASASRIAGPSLAEDYWQMSPRRAQPHVVLFLQHLLCKSWQFGHDEELHVQLPLSQVRLLVHTCPHEPQLLLSVCSATHTPVQFV